MNRIEIIQQLKPFFSIEELVCPHTFIAWGERSWQFLGTDFLHTLLVIRRDILKVPMNVNNYKWGGSFDERGSRCNICSLVKDKSSKGISYLSAHVLGEGCDFTTKEYTAEQCRQIIISKKELLPYPIRLEKDVTWCHMDVYDYMNGNKVNMF